MGPAATSGTRACARSRAGPWLFRHAMHLADLRRRAGQPSFHHLEQHHWLRLVHFQDASFNVHRMCIHVRRRLADASFGAPIALDRKTHQRPEELGRLISVTDPELDVVKALDREGIGGGAPVRICQRCCLLRCCPEYWASLTRGMQMMYKSGMRPSARGKT